MINDKPKVLFVDDEENIRLTLGMYLDEKGFRVTTAATVPEALKLITQQKFDVLIADLNVGYPGDGFTVVSAMRRTHPEAVTFILTGYPAFDTALQAIRLQVDDYITKPTDTDELVDKIRQRLAEPKPVRYVPTKRLAEIVSENVGPITRHWLEAVRRDPELNAIPMSDSDRKDHVPRFLQVALKISSGDGISDSDRTAAQKHGAARRRQGYSLPLLLRETRLLEKEIAGCVQENLLSVLVSYLIPDLISIHQTIQALLEESVAAFLQEGRKR
ncbi:MAG TPA: response regulator [Terriglobales bacterium]|nr:response regulator [Terriglobales bacterium]